VRVRRRARPRRRRRARARGIVPGVKIALTPTDEHLRIELAFEGDAAPQCILAELAAPAQPDRQLAQVHAFFVALEKRRGGGACPATFFVRDGLIDVWFKTRGRDVEVRGEWFESRARVGPRRSMFVTTLPRRELIATLGAALATLARA
jgi:hypothetical protein